MHINSKKCLLPVKNYLLQCVCSHRYVSGFPCVVVLRLYPVAPRFKISQQPRSLSGCGYCFCAVSTDDFHITYIETYPLALIHTSGEYVGLPEGNQGSLVFSKGLP